MGVKMISWCGCAGIAKLEQAVNDIRTRTKVEGSIFTTNEE